MDPNATLEILRAAVVDFREAYDSGLPESSTRHWADELIDLGDTMAEAFDNLDGWLQRGGFVPVAWKHNEELER